MRLKLLDRPLNEFRRLTVRALPLLRFGTSVADKIPTPEDTWAQVLAKGLAVADAAVKARAHGARFRDLVERYDLVERESETFVKLFFNTNLQNQFTLDRLPLGDNETLVEAFNEAGERLAFREHSFGGRLTVDGNFFVSKGLNLDSVMDELWRAHPNGVYVSVVREPGSWRTETSVLEITDVCGTLSTRAEAQLELLTARHRKFLRDGVHRCYLCFGPTGTGKSTFAVRFGKNFGGRTVKVDATSLNVIGVKDFGFILEVLKPSTLVIDDMDRAPVKEIAARLLFLMERLKARYPKTAIILTVNDTNKLDPALLRSERIDIPLEFLAPTVEETGQLVAQLLNHYGVNPDLWEPVVAAVEADDLTHAYVQGLCGRLRHEPLEEVLASVRKLRQLSKQAETPAPAPSP